MPAITDDDIYSTLPDIGALPVYCVVICSVVTLCVLLTTVTCC